jgi:DNA-binding NtrC family response regulator/pSer/pThr/pTyr-binding forkhead associated (FHA) protein
MAELVFFRQGEELLRVSLGDRTEIGRSSSSDVVLPDPGLSRNHATVVRDGDVYRIVDRSGHGIRVAGEDVAEAVLQEGVEIFLGAWRAVFRALMSETASATHPTMETAVRGQRAHGAVGPAYLRVLRNGRQRIVPVRGEKFTVGHDKDNDLTLDDKFVSARHARVEWRNGCWWIADLASKNGTFVGGAQVVQAELLSGTSISIGDVQLVFQIGEVPVQELSEGTAWYGMVSRDPGMRRIFAMIEKLAPLDLGVIILGETGTGKELVARALHEASGRKGPFVALNCGAIVPTLIGDELFGHEKGAFSGAERQRKGAFEEANEGTLFLDEIGDLPPDQQRAMLRVLAEGEVTRVGGARPIPISTRVVAATHRDLSAQVAADKFREDLFHRLADVKLHLPPLRARKGDVRLLAEHFLAEAAPRGCGARWTEEALVKLESSDWTGNVRQLRSVVRRALLHKGQSWDLGPDLVISYEVGERAPSRGDNNSLYLEGLSLDEIHREVTRLALRRHKGRRVEVVKELNIAKSTLMSWIQTWGLQNEGRETDEPEVREDGESEADSE